MPALRNIVNATIDQRARTPAFQARIRDLASLVEGFLRARSDTRLASFLERWPALETDEAQGATLPVVAALEPWRALVDCRIIAFELRRLARQLTWSQTYSPDDFGPGFLERYGWTELIGLRGPIRSDRLACGFLLLGPATEYPMHRHVAEEIYIPISGTASWRAGDQDWSVRPEGEIILHGSLVPHAMRTAAEPLLALYLWQDGDLVEKSQID